AGEDSTRIWVQEASNSSANTAGNPVQTPWPASTCLDITVTVLSGSTRTNGMASPVFELAAAAPAAVVGSGSSAPRVSPAPAREVNFRKSRRDTSAEVAPANTDMGSFR